jgi:shikimate kinase
MAEQKTNIILIGMPGSGKSTVGVILAKFMSQEFIDTDLLIQVAQSRSLQDIVDKDGCMTLRMIEEKVILGLDCNNCVISTGGSAVYSDAAMTYLKSNGVAVFLDVNLSTLQSRIRDFETRGLAKRPDQTFSDLYLERSSLYIKYADVRVDCTDLSQEEVCEAIMNHSKLRNLIRS